MTDHCLRWIGKETEQGGNSLDALHMSCGQRKSSVWVAGAGELKFSLANIISAFNMVVKQIIFKYELLVFLDIEGVF